MKVVIISAPIGSGHVRAGRAVGQALLAKDPNCKVVYANVFDFFSPLAGRFILGGYLRVLALFPQLYASAYNWGNSSRLALWGRSLVSRILAAKMADFFNLQQPDAVVCTHATPAGLVATLLRNRQLAVPVVAVVTDFVVHRLWAYQELTHYCVAAEQLRQTLANLQVPLAKSSATGIPVDLAFTKRLSSVNPDVTPIVMLMGGGAGLLPLTELVQVLERLNADFKIIVVCGSNSKEYAKLNRILPQLTHSVEVYGFVENIAELMSRATCLVTKPGGLTIAESLCIGVPLIFYQPIPGQEAANAQHLCERQLAIRVDEKSELLAVVKNFITTNGGPVIDSDLAKPQAAMTVADKIFDLIRKSP